MLDLLQNDEIQRLLLMTKDGLLFAIWETLYTTVISTFFAYVIGLPLGVLAVVGEPGGVLPLPRPVISAACMDGGGRASADQGKYGCLF